MDFGAFVALDDGLEGLLHLSEMGDGALKEPYSYVQKGDHLKLRISHLEPEKRRVGFTQRWGTELDEEDGDGVRRKLRKVIKLRTPLPLTAMPAAPAPRPTMADQPLPMMEPFRSRSNR